MDRIKFSLGVCYDKDLEYAFTIVDISINGRKLLDLVTEIERENARRMGLDYGGNYASGIRFTPDIEPGEHFLGRNALGQFWAYVWVLGCICGHYGCWDVFAKIEVTPTLVRWNEVVNPWLVNGLPTHWHTELPEDFVAFDYSSIGPYVFDRQQYKDALNELRDK